MTLFELIFGLTAIILGLALTNITASLHRLALAGRKVRWAPEPVLLTLLVTMIIVYVWLGNWSKREMSSISAGRALLDVARMMALYFAAASCLPEPDRLPDEGLDLANYYYGTRALTFGALIVGLALFNINFAIGNPRFHWRTDFWEQIPLIALYGSMIFIRARWYHLLVLTAVIVMFGFQVFGTVLTQPPR